MFLLQAELIRKPICPTLVHDESTALAICVILLVLCVYALFRVMAYFNEN